MENPVVISGIGMLVLFLALALLYGLMYALTGLTRKRTEAKAKQQESRKTADGDDGALTLESGLRRRAAAIAVALARAERELPRAGAPGAEEESARWRISPWRALHHQRQLTRNRPSGRAQ